MWFLPSLDRAEQCAAVIEQFTKVADTPGVLLVNGGNIDEYKKIKLPANWELFASDTNLGVCGAMNALFKEKPNEPWYGLICDDERLLEKNGDRKLIEAAGSWKMAHGNDYWQSDKRIHGYVVMGGELIRTMGFWALPGLWHWFVDDSWELLARECNLRVFLQDVKVEHRHWMAGKGVKDAVSDLAGARGIQDREVFLKWAQGGEAKRLVDKIKERMGESK